MGATSRSKIDNATKVFSDDFIVRFAVRFERVVFRQLTLRLNRYPLGFTGAKKIDSWRAVAEQLHRQNNENKQRSTCNSCSAREKRRRQT